LRKLIGRPFLAARPTATVPDMLAEFQLIHDVERNDWTLWLAAAGATKVDASRGAAFSGGNGAFEAMKAGLCVALMRRSFIDKALSDGTLIAPFPFGVASRLAYHLVYPATALDRPTTADVRHWLLSEAGRWLHFARFSARQKVDYYTHKTISSREFVD
jgi:DNA-binding transcriptional LysR family regulator